MTRRRLQIIRLIVASIPLIAVIVAAVVSYQQSGSWRFAMTTAGIVAFTLFGFMLLTRFGGAGLNVLSPNSVKRLDDRCRDVQFQSVAWQSLSLTDAERKMLADWIQRNPPGWSGRAVSIATIVIWMAFWFFMMKSSRLTLELQLLLTFAIGVPLFITARRIRQRIELTRSANALRFIGRCLACHYDLKTVSRQSDGCAICPECGAAWKQR